MHIAELAQIRTSRKVYQPICGVYFLFDGENLVYVGQSIDVYVRLYSHRAFKFDSFWIQECQPSELLVLESIHINKFRPKNNVSVPGRKNPRSMGRTSHKKYGSVLSALPFSKNAGEE